MSGCAALNRPRLDEPTCMEEYMRLSDEVFKSLEQVVSGLTGCSSFDEQKSFLRHNGVNARQFVDLMETFRTCKELNEFVDKFQSIDPLDEEDSIMRIFAENSSDAILASYSMRDLQRMYYAVYGQAATSSYTKTRIVIALKDRMHAMRRAEAFARRLDEMESRL